MYNVILELGLCSCANGEAGKLCKHVLLALKDNGMESHLTTPRTKDELDVALYIAEGKQVDKEGDWLLESLHIPHTNGENIDGTSSQ